MSGLKHKKGLRCGTTRGFSLVELCVTIAVIGILAVLATPAFQGARNRSMSAGCQSNLRQIFTASQLYIADNGTIPVTDYWAARNLYPYLYPSGQSVSTLTRQQGMHTVFMCPGTLSTETLLSVWSSYGINAQFYSGFNLLQLQTHAVHPDFSELIAYLDANATNVFDSTPGRVPTKRHGGTVNICFADGHIENRSVSQVGTTQWRNLFYGYARY